VLVVGNKIAKISKEPLAVANGRIIDGCGRTLIPGIIDDRIMLPAATLGNEVGVREGRCEASCKKTQRISLKITWSLRANTVHADRINDTTGMWP